MARLFKPATVSFAGITMETTGGVQIDTGIEFKDDNSADTPGVGRSRIPTRRTTVTFSTPTFSEEVLALVAHATIMGGGSMKTLKLNKTGICDQGDLVIFTESDDGAKVTITLPNAQNKSSLNTNVGNKGGDYGSVFPLTFAGYWASDDDGDAQIVIDRTPTGTV